MPATVIVNARLVNEGRVTEGDLRIENGRIVVRFNQPIVLPGLGDAQD